MRETLWISVWLIVRGGKLAAVSGDRWVRFSTMQDAVEKICRYDLAHGGINADLRFKRSWPARNEKGLTFACTEARNRDVQWFRLSGRKVDG